MEYYILIEIDNKWSKIAIFLNEGDRDICLAAFRETYLDEEFTEGDNA